jgi:hypothetical protein
LKIKLSEIRIRYRPDGTVDNQRSDFDPILIGKEIAAESTKISDDNPYKETLVQIEQDKIAVKYDILPIFTSVRSMGINTVPIMLDPDLYLVTGHVRFACLLGIGAEEAEATILEHTVSDLERTLLQGAENAIHTQVTPYDWVWYVRRIRNKMSGTLPGKKRVTDVDIARICGISTSSLHKYTTVGNLGIEAVIERLRPPYSLPFGYVYDLVRQVSKEVQELPEVLELLDRRPLPDVNVMIWDIEQLVMRKRKEIGIEPDEDESGRTEITIFDTITNPMEVSKQLARRNIPIVRKIGSKFPGELAQITRQVLGWKGWFGNACREDGYHAVPEMSYAFFYALSDFLNFLNRKRKIGWRIVWIERTQKFVVRKNGKDEDDTEDDM